MTTRDNIRIEATDRSPDVDFNFAANSFTLKGESYPEDVGAFYGPLLDRLEAYLGTLNGGAVRFNFELVYFNPESGDVFLEIVDMLDEVAGGGTTVNIRWRFAADDGEMKDIGTEFAEDLEYAALELEPLGA